MELEEIRGGLDRMHVDVGKPIGTWMAPVTAQLVDPDHVRDVAVRYGSRCTPVVVISTKVAIAAYVP